MIKANLKPRYQAATGILLLVGLFLSWREAAGSEVRFRAPLTPPKAQYVIEAGIDIADARVLIDAMEKITFKNTTSTPLDVIALDWRIDSSSTLSVSMNGRELKLLNPDWGLPRRTPLFFALPKTVKSGKTVKLALRFSSQRPSRSGTVSLQRWHPRLWWEGIPTADAYRVKAEIPPGYALAASGRLNKRSGYYENANVTTKFGLYLARGLESAEKDIAGVRITSLFSPEGEECARFCLDTAEDVIAFYQDWHGFFPFKSLFIIPGADRPMGGYPFASGIVVIHGQQQFEKMPRLHWQWITAHEIGHQYWGEYVMSDDTPSDYTESWLMIGMGICADRAYTEYRILGDEKHESFFNRYLEGLRNRYDVTVDATESIVKKQRFDRNNVLIHGKGYSILSALRSVVGDEIFEKIYIRAVKNFGGKRLGYRDFWKLCNQVTGSDLRWFFEQWVRTNRYLCYQITSQESIKAGEVYNTRITVERKGDSIAMPIPVKVVFEDGSSQTAVTDRLLKSSILRFEGPSPLKQVILDPNRRLAMLEEPLALLPEELPDAISQLPWSGASEEARELYQQAVAAKLDIVGLWFKLGMCVFEGGFFDEAFDAFQHMIALKPAKNYHFYALIWMGNVRDAQGKRAEAVAYYKQSLAYDTGSGSRHDQFKIESSRAWVEERIKAPFDWKSVIKK